MFSIRKIIILVLIIVISVFFVCSNKQLTSKKGGETSVAYWNFKDNETSKIISLADTITKSEYTISKNCIAPGTEGRFSIIVDCKGANVKIAYEIKVIKEENNPSNLYFYIDDDNKRFNTIKDLVKNNNFSGTIDFNKKQIKEYIINWKWPLEHMKSDGTIDETKDIEDTNFAKKKLEYSFEIEISGKQSI